MSNESNIFLYWESKKPLIFSEKVSINLYDSIRNTFFTYHCLFLPIENPYFGFIDATFRYNQQDLKLLFFLHQKNPILFLICDQAELLTLLSRT